jgi:SRSO17 transposase
VRWREGTKGAMQSRFALLEVRVAHRDYLRVEPRVPELLLIEWPSGESEPTRYWLSTVPRPVELAELVRLVKIRWRIERDFQELKDEIGLDHYEGRSWRGFHHHGALCIAAYAFLAAERARLSPPQHLLPSCAPLAYPKTFAHAEPPVRPERHNPSSISSLRIGQARLLAARLPRCPWCGTDGRPAL